MGVTQLLILAHIGGVTVKLTYHSHRGGGDFPPSNPTLFGGVFLLLIIIMLCGNFPTCH